MKRLLLVLAVLVLLAGCNPDPPSPLPEEQRACYVSMENWTNHDMAWKIRKSSASEGQTVTIFGHREYNSVKTEKHELYVLDLYVLGGYRNDIDGTLVVTSRVILDSTSIEIDTEKYINSFTFTYGAQGLEYTWE